MTQRERVLRALRSGSVNTTDFIAPTCDGGLPILRLAARIFELQQDGFRITSKRQLNNTTSYRLEAERTGTPSDADEGSTGTQVLRSDRVAEGVAGSLSPTLFTLDGSYEDVA